MSKADELLFLAQSVASDHKDFFLIKGPGKGDRDTGVFMRTLRGRALAAFGEDYSEKRICGKSSFCVDFYFPGEETIVEIALGFKNPTSEYERDVFKALLARDAGQAVSRLVFICKPGALRRAGSPGGKRHRRLG
jgi:hypothetical protein